MLPGWPGLLLFVQGLMWLVAFGHLLLPQTEQTIMGMPMGLMRAVSVVVDDVVCSFSQQDRQQIVFIVFFHVHQCLSGTFWIGWMI